MAVVIIKTDEKFSIEVEGATFYYRRIKGHIRAGIVDRFTNNRTGKTDWGKASLAMLQHGLLGWKNVIEPNGIAVPFDAEYIDAIPDGVQAIIVEAMGSNVSQIELDVEVKNLKTTQSNSSPTTGSPAPSVD